MITIQLLGGASLRSGDVALSGPPAQRHRVALLTLVAASWPQPLSRDRAMALLWPERDLASSRRLLNLAVHVLRSALGADSITSTVDGLLLNPACSSCDLQELRAAIAADDAERIARLHTGVLLDGFHLDESVEFGYWLDERRREITHAYIGALIALTQSRELSGDVHGRIGAWRRLVAADPHSGGYAQGLMRALADAGDWSGAAQHANEYAQRMRTDLELEPDPAVVALAEQLRCAAEKRHSSASPGELRTASVAVLPFRNLTADAENEYFADGITEDVIAQLSKIRAMKVIAHGSVMRFKQRQASLREIGSSLGVATILDGSVRRAGDRVRIVAQLIDAETDRTLWSETYDRQITEIFAIQAEVALHIAGALEAELTSDENARVRREPTRDIMAYRLFLQGRQWLIEYTPESMERAIGYLERAVARDPDFALAHATIGMAYAELAEIGGIVPDVAYRRATDAAANALRLDPDLGAAHCTMAHLKAIYEKDWVGSEREFRQALELSPGNADALDYYGRLCSGLARHDEAIALATRAHELDPLAHKMDLATFLIRAGRLDEAVARAEDAVEIDPCSRALATLGWAYFLSGRQSEGLENLERAVALSPESTIWLAQLGAAEGMAGNRARALEILGSLEARAATSYVSPYHFAYVHTGLGNADRAVDWLERAVADRTGSVYGIKASFLFASLRPHAGFHGLLRRMNLA